MNERNHWKIEIHNKQTFVIESENENSSIRLCIPFKYLHKDILIIDDEDFSEIIFSYNLITINTTYEKMYGNNSIVQSLNQCTDFGICLSPKTTANLFLDYLQ
ncbi:unnamed protein product [Rotaria magnacalcarata]|uniref:Uncharacterized protein n=1 Tax=Rotaria magnacalcarata TaxID=392030 RepID=A0A819WQ77_9BILA|nr:unnamed protein product [Rotaria magnacalcarata]CAF2120060.1 unnamed protein product [Rotaria magnacalcarata]CAF4128436.1 unnamed protein product [Rotaria magnacalcarata]CAF4205021.1 unnamed protein product [Rotaria magnacalcarata]